MGRGKGSRQEIENVLGGAVTIQGHSLHGDFQRESPGLSDSSRVAPEVLWDWGGRLSLGGGAEWPDGGGGQMGKERLW